MAASQTVRTTAPQRPAPTGDLALFRTRIVIDSPARRARLDALGIVVLEETADGRPPTAAESGAVRGPWSAVVLADDEQLETLARLRYEPRATDEFVSLVEANTDPNSWLAAGVAPLVTQAVSLRSQNPLPASPAAGEERMVARKSLAAAARALTPEQRTALADLTSLDDDADGLTNAQEAWWCTDPLNADTDGDGASDGAEVAAAKDWLGNRRAGPPSTGKPFAGWPPQIPGCRDDDLDSVPDLAERWDLGLNMNRESTDRDKFDDGQELFGNTYCPGSGGFCGYGALPRNEDWGVIFAEMPTWVKAPGNHPFVAAFPVPEIDVVESSLKVETVTVVTTDYVISEGTEKSYSTAKTEGTSTSVADTVTWNEWQEVSESLQQRIPSTRFTDGLGPYARSTDGFWKRAGKIALGTAKIAGGAASIAAACAGSAVAATYTLGALAVPGAVICAGTVAGGGAAIIDGGSDWVDAFSPDETQDWAFAYFLNQKRKLDGQRAFYGQIASIFYQCRCGFK